MCAPGPPEEPNLPPREEAPRTGPPRAESPATLELRAQLREMLARGGWAAARAVARPLGVSTRGRLGDVGRALAAELDALDAGSLRRAATRAATAEAARLGLLEGGPGALR